ncbi:hypothetical protein [Halorubellus salinus]|uniref:hypothetical protein n=1 Tax=Halorubellus salinus TaxID=755309 RepID=UPI001D061F25|nr:hypothetical protein [Halorubellus salinus]
MVDDDRYGEDGWHDDVDDWFDREIAPGAPDDWTDADVERAREEMKTAFLDRGITDAERERRAERGQRRLLESFDDDVVREYAASLDDVGTTEPAESADD